MFCAYPLSSFIYTMPHLSDRQKHANALLEAFILQTIIEAQESTDAPDTDSTGSNWETDSEKEDNQGARSGRFRNTQLPNRAHTSIIPNWEDFKSPLAGC